MYSFFFELSNNGVLYNLLCHPCTSFTFNLDNGGNLTLWESKHSRPIFWKKEEKLLFRIFFNTDFIVKVIIRSAYALSIVYYVKSVHGIHTD